MLNSVKVQTRRSSVILYIIMCMMYGITLDYRVWVKGVSLCLLTTPGTSRVTKNLAGFIVSKLIFLFLDRYLRYPLRFLSWKAVSVSQHSGHRMVFIDPQEYRTIWGLTDQLITANDNTFDPYFRQQLPIVIVLLAANTLMTASNRTNTSCE